VITDAHSDEQFRVLDLHHHLGPDEGARATDPRSTTAVFPERVAIMDRFGVDQAVLMPPNSASGGPSMTPANDHVAAAVRRDPARFPAGVARIDLAEGLTAARAELHRAVSELGLRGAVWHHRFQGVFLDHPDMPELARICGMLGIPAFIHVIEGSSLESPWRLERIVDAAPDVAVVALDAFSSWDRAGEMTAIAGRHDNLWCELGALSAVAGNHVERYVESVGPERLLLGTDLFMSGGRSMTYQVPFAVLEVVHLNLDASAKRAILYDNAARLLGLQPSTRLENAAPR
jgi:predicted TIM-barrel fold metal-dependent hydrolase